MTVGREIFYQVVGAFRNRLFRAVVVVVVVGFVRETELSRALLRPNGAKRMDFFGKSSSGKRTTPGIPTWSPTVVLTGPDDA